LCLAARHRTLSLRRLSETLSRLSAAAATGRGRDKSGIVGGIRLTGSRAGCRDFVPPASRLANERKQSERSETLSACRRLRMGTISGIFRILPLNVAKFRAINSFAATRARADTCWKTRAGKYSWGKRNFESTKERRGGRRSYRSSSTRQSGPSQFHSELSKQGFSSPSPPLRRASDEPKHRIGRGFPLYTGTRDHQPRTINIPNYFSSPKNHRGRIRRDALRPEARDLTRRCRSATQTTLLINSRQISRGNPPNGNFSRRNCVARWIAGCRD